MLIISYILSNNSIPIKIILTFIIIALYACLLLLFQLVTKDETKFILKRLKRFRTSNNLIKLNK